MTQEATPEVFYEDTSYPTQEALEADLKTSPFQIRGLNFDEHGLRSGDHPLTPNASRRLAQLLTIPSTFLDRCTPRLSKDIVQEFLSRQERGISVAVDGKGQARTFLFSDYIQLPITEVMRTLRGVIQDEPLAVTKNAPGISSYSVFITSERAFKVPDGKEIFFGVALRSSYDGATATKVTLSLFRPWCTNGAYFTEASYSLPRRYLHSQQDMLAALADQTQLVMSNRAVIVDNIKRLCEQKVADLESTISHTSQRYNLPRRLNDLVMEASSQEDVTNMWGVMNAYTRAANDQALPISYREQLWTIPGEAVRNIDQPCPVCGQEFHN